MNRFICVLCLGLSIISPSDGYILEKINNLQVVLNQVSQPAAAIMQIAVPELRREGTTQEALEAYMATIDDIGKVRALTEIAIYTGLGSDGQRAWRAFNTSDDNMKYSRNLACVNAILAVYNAEISHIVNILKGRIAIGNIDFNSTYAVMMIDRAVHKNAGYIPLMASLWRASYVTYTGQSFNIRDSLALRDMIKRAADKKYPNGLKAKHWIIYALRHEPLLKSKGLSDKIISFLATEIDIESFYEKIYQYPAVDVVGRAGIAAKIRGLINRHPMSEILVRLRDPKLRFPMPELMRFAIDRALIDLEWQPDRIGTTLESRQYTEVTNATIFMSIAKARELHNS